MRLRHLFSTALGIFLAICLSAGLAGATAVPVHGQTVPIPAANPHAATLDINTATPAQLKALPGIGDAYAKRIIDNRPYTAKNQLVTRGILPQATYDKIRDEIVAHRAARP